MEVPSADGPKSFKLKRKFVDMEIKKTMSTLLRKHRFLSAQWIGNYEKIHTAEALLMDCLHKHTVPPFSRMKIKSCMT